jgi:hypothetical protein
MTETTADCFTTFAMTLFGSSLRGGTTKQSTRIYNSVISRKKEATHLSGRSPRYARDDAAMKRHCDLAAGKRSNLFAYLVTVIARRYDEAISRLITDCFSTFAMTGATTDCFTTFTMTGTIRPIRINSHNSFFK